MYFVVDRLYPFYMSPVQLVIVWDSYTLCPVKSWSLDLTDPIHALEQDVSWKSCFRKNGKIYTPSEAIHIATCSFIFPCTSSLKRSLCMETESILSPKTGRSNLRTPCTHKWESLFGRELSTSVEKQQVFTTELTTRTCGWTVSFPNLLVCSL